MTGVGCLRQADGLNNEPVIVPVQNVHLSFAQAPHSKTGKTKASLLNNTRFFTCSHPNFNDALKHPTRV